MSKVFNMVGGGGGPAASIFVTGLSETDTVTATNGSKTLTGKWTQKTNPAYHGLPDGYTELEYIESTGTQYIETNVALSSTVECWLDFQLTSTNSPQVLCGADQSGSATIQYQVVCDGPSKGLRLTISGVEARPTSNADLNRHSLGLNWDGRYSYDGSDLGEAGVYSGLTDITVALCRSNYHGGLYASMKIYASKIKKDSSLVRDFIPCKRTSDNAIGLYDLVTSTFFGNAGTGTFTAGQEIPQTIDGFLIKPIRDFGTWTVTATDGVQTATQDVLVDVITEYEIEMMYSKLYLYRDGDECEDVTGGWVISYGSAGVQSTVLTKNTDNMYISYTSGAGAGKSGGCGTANTIDLTQYTKLFVKASNFGGTNDYALQLIAGNTNTGDGNTYAVSYYTSLPSDGILTCDISNVNNSAFIRLLMQANKWANIHQVWLE